MRILLIAALMLLLSACDQTTPAERARIAEALRADNPSALAIQWSGTSSLWVLMPDDGTSRDGLAQSYCEMLKQKGHRGATVRIQDGHAMARGQQRTLGKAMCR